MWDTPENVQKSLEEEAKKNSKEVLFYKCELCGNKGANRRYICSYCGTPLIYDEIYKYTQRLYEKYLT